jgi:dTDP-4-amino-4,6-dideoxygalactose transaminase
MSASKENPEFITFGLPRFSEAEIAAASDTLRSRSAGGGVKTRQFQQEFARYQGSKYGLSVSSCSAGLVISLRAMDIGPGDEVITTAMTFTATVNVILEVGATPKLVDIDPKTGLFDLDLVEAAITPKTKAIIPVHLYGVPVDMDRLLALRQKYGVRIIHDCAHAIETEWNGKRLGSFADICCYSFYPTKNITTVEGGMICSDDEFLMERAGVIAGQGMTKDAWKRFSSAGYKHYDVTASGFKFNSTDMQAAIGLIQLSEIEKKAKRRTEIWTHYQTEFANLGELIELPTDIVSPHRHAHHLFTVLVRPPLHYARDEFMHHMTKSGIGTGVHYQSILQLSFFAKTLNLSPESLPKAHDLGSRTLSLPLTPYLSDDDVTRVVRAVQLTANTARKRPAA